MLQGLAGFFGGFKGIRVPGFLGLGLLGLTNGLGSRVYRV